jgi:hypothetical protein
MQGMRSVFAVALVGTTLVFAAQASAAVKATKLPGTVTAGDYASLTVRVTPKARCTIKVVYDTVTSRAKGLAAKTGPTITWRWRVGSNTHAGRWPITIDCGKSGRLVLRIRVIGT